MTNWKEYKLGEIAEIVMGQSPKGETCNNDGIGIPLLNGPTEFGVHCPFPTQYTTDPKKYSAPEDLLFCVRGSTTGRMNWSDQKYAIGRGIGAIRHKKGSKLKHFIKGLIDYNLPLLLQSATGSTFPNVSKEQLNNLIVRIPDLPTQTAIGAILSSLDDKIELNNKINQELENLAQTLFKQWFIDFEFRYDFAQGKPNENGAPYRSSGGEMVDSELGMIPKGWEVVLLSDLLTVKYGKDHKHLQDGKIPLYGSGGIMRFVEKPLYTSESILIPRKGTLSNLFYVVEPFWSVDTMFYSEIQDPTFGKYLFHVLKNFNLAAMNVGSAVPSMTTKVLNALQVVKPPKTIMQSFDTVVSSLYEALNQNLKENQSLTHLRDTLLPKLISGELEVSEAPTTTTA
jgi:type I restriction enzyme, S subunit